MSHCTRWVVLCFVVAVALIVAVSSSTCAQENRANSFSPDAPTAAPQADPTLRPIDRGDNAWMLTSSALVLFMTAPGLAMFYGGLVRKKNVLGVMMQCLTLMGLLSVIWGLYGYSLAFGGVAGEAGYSPYIGNTSYLFMNDVQRHFDDSTKTMVTPMEG